MPTDDNKSSFAESSGDVITCIVSMTKSSSYMSSASSSSYSTSNTCDGEYSHPPNPTATSSNASSSMTGAATSCLVNRHNSVEGGGEGQTAAVHREPHRVKFAEDRNEYLTSSDPETDYGCFDQPDSAHGGRWSSAATAGRWRDGGEDCTGVADWSSGDRGTAMTHRPIIKPPPPARPRSPENHENPFIADGELCRVADYIIRNSTISRRRIRIADPDCTLPPPTSSSSSSSTNREDDLGTTGSGGVDDDGDYDDDFRWRQSLPSGEQKATTIDDVIVVATTSTRLDTAPKQWDLGDNNGGERRVRLLNGSPPTSSALSEDGCRSTARLNGQTTDMADSANDDDDTAADGRLESGPTEFSRPTIALLVDERRDSDGNRPGSAGLNGQSGSSDRPSSVERRRRKHCCQVQ